MQAEASQSEASGFSQAGLRQLPHRPVRPEQQSRPDPVVERPGREYCEARPGENVEVPADSGGSDKDGDHVAVAVPAMVSGVAGEDLGEEEEVELARTHADPRHHKRLQRGPNF